MEAGAEVFAIARKDDHAHRIVAVQFGKCRLYFAEARLRKGIGLVGTVDAAFTANSLATGPCTASGLIDARGASAASTAEPAASMANRINGKSRRLRRNEDIGFLRKAGATSLRARVRCTADTDVTGQLAILSVENTMRADGGPAISSPIANLHH